MREYYCDLCGEMIGVAHADFQKTTNNELHMVTWIDMPRQREKIRCAYDLCDDCAKRIHRKLADIQNNHRWRHGTRPWSETKEAQK